MQQGRTVFLYALAASTAYECVKKFARVAYVILCNSLCKVRHNECTHGDEKPPPPIRDGWVYRGKERMYGGKKRVQGRRGEASAGGLGGGAAPPHGLNKTFLLLGFAIFSAIQTWNSSKIFEKK